MTIDAEPSAPPLAFDPREVTLADLPERLMSVRTTAEVQALADADTRASAPPIYAARLAELAEAPVVGIARLNPAAMAGTTRVVVVGREQEIPITRANRAEIEALHLDGLPLYLIEEV